MVYNMAHDIVHDLQKNTVKMQVFRTPKVYTRHMKYHPPKFQILRALTAIYSDKYYSLVKVHLV